MRALRKLGVPYEQGEIDGARESIALQAKAISDDVVTQRGPTGMVNKEITALTAYLQRLGTDIKWQPPVEASGPLDVGLLDSQEGR